MNETSTPEGLTETPTPEKLTEALALVLMLMTTCPEEREDYLPPLQLAAEAVAHFLDDHQIAKAMSIACFRTGCDCQDECGEA